MPGQGEGSESNQERTRQGCAFPDISLPGRHLTRRPTCTPKGHPVPGTLPSGDVWAQLSTNEESVPNKLATGKSNQAICCLPPRPPPNPLSPWRPGSVLKHKLTYWPLHMYLRLQVGREPQEQVARRQSLEMLCSCKCPSLGREVR